MCFAGKKGKKAKGKAVSLQDFLAQTPGNGDSPALSAALNPPKRSYLNWGDEQDDEPNMPTPLLQLPTAPRASRNFDDDSVPRSGPFLAYLSNLPYDLDEDGLADFFGELALVSVRMPREDGGRSRGYGYVEFETREDLIDAISMPDPTINNRHIRIDVSTESDRRQRQGGRYGDREPLSAGESNWRRAGPGGPPGGDRGGDRGGFGGDRDRDRGNSRFGQARDAPSRDTNSDWRVGERPAFEDGGGSRRGGDDRDFRDRYGGRRSNYEERGGRDRDGPRRDASPQKERPKLQLQPRTLPIEPIVVAREEGAADAEEERERRSPSPVRAKPVPAAAIFGAAKPVDTAAREREIEERLERERAEERRLREEARDKARKEQDEEREGGGAEERQAQDEGEEEATKPAPKPAIMSWRRERDDQEDGAPPQGSSFRRHTSPRRDDRDRRDDRRGGGFRGGDDRRDDRDRDRRTGDYGGRGGAPRTGDRERRMDRNDRRDGDRGGRDWNRDRGDRDQVQQGGNGGRWNEGTEQENEHRKDNGLTEEEREKRLAEKMPKHKPPEGPNLSVSNKFAFLGGDDDEGEEADGAN